MKKCMWTVPDSFHVFGIDVGSDIEEGVEGVD